MQRLKSAKLRMTAVKSRNEVALDETPVQIFYI
jgi:hypothetical protein